MGKKAEIKFMVDLDSDKMPSSIKWEATDSKQSTPQNCDAMLISLWDGDAKNSLGIDLWTKNMLIDDMNIFVFQTLKKLSETYGRATKDKDSQKIISQCADEFAQKLNLLNNK